MKTLSLKQLAAILLLSLAAPLVHAAAAIVMGESAPGVYENITSTSQKLDVNVTGSVAPITAVTATITTPTVTNSSGTLLAANSARKSVLIQNNHASAVIYLNFTTTATTAHLAIGAGQSLYLSGIVPVAAIRAIGSVASNTAIVVLEGQ